MKLFRTGFWIGAVLLCATGCGTKSPAVSNTARAEEAIASLQYEEAVSFADSAVAAGEDARRALRLKGIAYLKNAQYQDAIGTLRSALAMSDGIVTDMDIDMNLYLASACKGIGDYAQAVEAYDHILALKPSDVASLYARGEALLQDGKLAEHWDVLQPC